MLWVDCFTFKVFLIMAGRGRGRGSGGVSGKSLADQLGIDKTELIKEPNIGPPETFPALQFRPVPLPTERSIERSYMLAVKKELRDYLQNSAYNITLDSVKPEIERYSDRLRCLNKKKSLDISWSRVPKELWPSYITKTPVKMKSESNVQNPAKKQKTDVNVSEKLELLEKLEKSGQNEEKDSDEEKEEEVVEDEGEDEEMDEGTDYINNYFDNGEDYIEDENDALEEGGVF